MEPHVGWIHVQLRRLGVAPADLPDVTQDTLVAVHGHWSEYDPDRPIRPRLFAFAARLAANHRRRPEVRRARAGVSDPMTDALAHEGPGPDAALDASRDRALVLVALESLDDDRRAVFVAAEIEGLSMPEIAASLGIPLNTGYTRLRLARTDFVAAVTRLRPRTQP